MASYARCRVKAIGGITYSSCHAQTTDSEEEPWPSRICCPSSMENDVRCEPSVTVWLDRILSSRPQSSAAARAVGASSRPNQIFVARFASTRSTSSCRILAPSEAYDWTATALTHRASLQREKNEASAGALATVSNSSARKKHARPTSALAPWARARRRSTAPWKLSLTRVPTTEETVLPTSSSGRESTTTLPSSNKRSKPGKVSCPAGRQNARLNKGSSNIEVSMLSWAAMLLRVRSSAGRSELVTQYRRASSSAWSRLVPNRWVERISSSTPLAKASRAL